jgi:hypothetical protein
MLWEKYLFMPKSQKYLEPPRISTQTQEYWNESLVYILIKLLYGNCVKVSLAEPYLQGLNKGNTMNRYRYIHLLNIVFYERGREKEGMWSVRLCLSCMPMDMSPYVAKGKQVADRIKAAIT